MPKIRDASAVGAQQTEVEFLRPNRKCEDILGRAKSQLHPRLPTEGLDFLPEDLRHVWHYAFEHMIRYGQYSFNLRREPRRDALFQAVRL